MEGHYLELVLGDAKRSVDRAIAFYMATGRKTALAEFSNPKGRFAEGEQYVYVLDINGIMLAHPINEEYQGKDFYRVQDCEGKSFIKQIVDTANYNGGLGWVAYKWYDPATKRMRPKTVYFEKVDSMIFCSGVYGANPVCEILELPPGDDELSASFAEPATAIGRAETDALVMASPEEELFELVPDDARLWVGKAIVFYRANGRGIALAEFSNPSGRFVRAGQYVYVLDLNGTMLAHPVNERYLGRDFYRIQDSDGKSFIKQIVDRVNDNGSSGWVEYKWFNPATRRDEPKTVYFEKLDDMIFCSGVYVLRP